MGDIKIKTESGETFQAKIAYSSFPKTRLYIENFQNDKGIRCHNFLTAFFVKIFGSGIEEIKTATDKVIYLNKGSFEKWKQSSGYKPVNNNHQLPGNFIHNALSENKNKTENKNNIENKNNTQLAIENAKKAENWPRVSYLLKNYSTIISNEKKKQKLKCWLEIKDKISKINSEEDYENITKEICEKAKNKDWFKKYTSNFNTRQKDLNKDSFNAQASKKFLEDQILHCCQKKIRPLLEAITENFSQEPVKNTNRQVNKNNGLVLGSFNQNTIELNNYGVSACTSISVQAAASLLCADSFESVNEQMINQIVIRGIKVHLTKKITHLLEIENFEKNGYEEKDSTVLETSLYQFYTDITPQSKNLIETIKYDTSKKKRSFPFAAIITRTPNTCCIVFKSDSEFWFFDSHGSVPRTNDKTKAGVRKYTNQKELNEDLDKYLKENHGNAIGITILQLKKNDF